MGWQLPGESILYDNVLDAPLLIVLYKEPFLYYPRILYIPIFYLLSIRCNQLN